jgi:acyl carrier protein
MTISSRTPEGSPNHCPLCGAYVRIEPSPTTGDAPCPACGNLLWFRKVPSGVWWYDPADVSPLREKLIQIIREKFGGAAVAVTDSTSFAEDVGADSLDLVELVMELEEEFEMTIPDTEAEKIGTIGEAIGYILQHR